MEKQADLLTQARGVLEVNDQGEFTVPAEGIYPHQWLWDSCFIAIGLRHIDTDRAKKEILSLLRGQWANGMLPNMIFDDGDQHKRDRNLWRSWLNPQSPDGIATTGITQPPMLAEAVLQVGKKLPLPERRTWYQTVFPAICAYHQWLYNERDPHKSGIVLQIHPWETGLDGTPPWLRELNTHQMPLWIRTARKLKIGGLINYIRRDVHYVPPGQRLSIYDGMAYYSMQRRLRRKAYDIDKILTHALLTVEDLTYNSIFIRANSCLKSISKAIDKPLPEGLPEYIKKTENALDQLWDAYSSQYYSRNYSTQKLIKEPSIATLMPLYAGSISKERAEQLVRLLKSDQHFGAAFPVPSVPVTSTYFKPHSYWQGPTWVNTNWLIIKGLEKYGYKEEAKLLTQKTIELVEKSGFYEYFSPLDGSPAGAQNFSWTAALVLDLLNSK